MDSKERILLLGSSGMLGKSLFYKLLEQKYHNVLTPKSTQLDLTNQQSVNHYIETYKPDHIILCAAKVGGILNNTNHPADFGYINGMIELNVLHAAYKFKVKKLLFLGSSCIYPKFCGQPMKEEDLLSGILEPTNEMYSLSKILGLKLCDAYRKQYGCNFVSCMPCNLYGPNDNFNEKESHVVPALIQRFHNAKINNLPEVICWGSGNQKREFLFVDDCADACIFLMNNYNQPGHINVGVGTDYTMKELTEIIKEVIGYTGNINWDTSKPDGTFQKLLNVEKINKLGWKYNTDLKDGLIKTYNWFLNKDKK